MADAGVNTEGSSTPKVEIPEVETIRELKAKSNISPGSGYDVLIDQLQRGKPDNIPDLMANELVRLHNDMEDIIPEIIPEEEVERARKELNSGNKERIEYLAEEVKKKYLHGRDFIKVRGEAVQLKSMPSDDLKAILADQLVRHIKNDYIGMRLRQRMQQERDVIAEQIKPPPLQR